MPEFFLADMSERFIGTKADVKLLFLLSKQMLVFVSCYRCRDAIDLFLEMKRSLKVRIFLGNYFHRKMCIK